MAGRSTPGRRQSRASALASAGSTADGFASRVRGKGAVGPLTPESFEAVEQELSLLLRRARRYLLTLAREVHPELEASTYFTLLFVTSRPTVRAADLADYLGIDKGAASRQVQQLERLGLLQRQPSPNDARAQLLTVTSQGKAHFEAARQARSLHVQERLGEWDPRDVATFAQLLSRFNALLT